MIPAAGVTVNGSSSGSGSGSGSVSVASVIGSGQPMNIQAVLKEIEAARAREAVLDADLTALVKTRATLASQIATLHNASDDVSAVHDTTQRMAAKIHQSSVSAIALSSKVRELDTAQSRLRDALGRVGSVLDLKHTITAVEKAIEAKDYGTAAKKTFRVLYGGNSGKGPIIESDSSYAALITLQAKVRSLVAAECDLAESNQHFGHVLRLTRLFPTLGLASRGLTKYCSTVRRIFASQLEKDGLALKCFPSGAVVPYTDLTTKIIERTAAVLATHSTTIQTEFGPGTQLRLVQELQTECSQQLEPIIKRFCIEHKILQRVSVVKNQKLGLVKPTRGGGDNKAMREAKGTAPQPGRSVLECVAKLLFV